MHSSAQTVHKIFPMSPMTLPSDVNVTKNVNSDSLAVTEHQITNQCLEIATCVVFAFTSMLNLAQMFLKYFAINERDGWEDRMLREADGNSSCIRRSSARAL